MDSPPERCGSAPPLLEVRISHCSAHDRDTNSEQRDEIFSIRVPGVTLSSLPVELRIKIFEHVLIASQPIEIRSSEFEGEKIETPADQKSEQDNLAALLLVDKQTHPETQELLYGRNTFSFSEGVVEGLGASALRNFVSSVSKENLACIRRIAISPYLPRRGWAAKGRRGKKGDELKRMVRAVMEHLTGVQDVELNLDGPYGPPVREDPAVEIKEGSGNLRKLKGAVRVLEERNGVKLRLRAGAWLDMRRVKKLLRRRGVESVVVD